MGCLCVLGSMQDCSPAKCVASPLDADQLLIAETLGGNRQAYSQIVQRYWGRIFARVHQIIGNFEDAEEVTSDAFTRALLNLGNFRHEASFSTWLYQIASNLARNRYWYWKRRRRERSLSLDVPLSDDGRTLQQSLPAGERDPAQQARWSEFCRAIEVQMELLPATHREVMEMRLFEGRSYEDISSRLNIPIGTVKSRISRARESLAESLGLQSRSQVRQVLSDSRFGGNIPKRSH